MKKLRLHFNNLKSNFIYSILLIGLFTTLSGCINYEEKLKLNLDGSGVIKIHYWTENSNKQFFDSAKSTITFDENILRDNFLSSKVKILSSQIWEDSDYKHAEIEVEFKNITDLNELKFFEEKPFSYEDGARGQKILNRKISSMGDNKEELNKYEYIFEYQLPGEIITDNAITKNGNVLKWRYKLNELNEAKTLSMTIKIGETVDYTIYIIVIIIIVIVILVLARWKKISRERKNS